MAAGSNGQRLYVLPEYDAVIGIVGGVEGAQYDQLERVFAYIVSAFAPETLPADPEGVARLSAALERFAGQTPNPPESLPELAETISGRTLELEENRYGIRQAVLTFDGNEEASIEQITPVGVLRLTVGLDGVFRENVVEFPTGTFMIGARGQWTYDNTFEMTLRWIEQGDERRLRFIFDEDTFTMTLAQYPTHGQSSIRVNGSVQGYP